MFKELIASAASFWLRVSHSRPITCPRCLSRTSPTAPRWVVSSDSCTAENHAMTRISRSTTPDNSPSGGRFTRRISSFCKPSLPYIRLRVSKFGRGPRGQRSAQRLDVCQPGLRRHRELSLIATHIANRPMSSPLRVRRQEEQRKRACSKARSSEAAFKPRRRILDHTSHASNAHGTLQRRTTETRAEMFTPNDSLRCSPRKECHALLGNDWEETCLIQDCKLLTRVESPGAVRISGQRLISASALNDRPGLGRALRSRAEL